MEGAEPHLARTSTGCHVVLPTKPGSSGSRVVGRPKRASPTTLEMTELLGCSWLQFGSSQFLLPFFHGAEELTSDTIFVICLPQFCASETVPRTSSEAGRLVNIPTYLLTTPSAYDRDLEIRVLSR